MSYIIYCTKWKLEVNPNKTKVGFHGRNIAREMFFHEVKAKILKSIKYLAIEFTRTGCFVKAIKYAYDQALKAMFSLLQTTRKQKLPINELFYSMVIPVLLYDCEIWG